MIDLESLPMWLGTISDTSVREDVKAKLLRYQREAKDVLARHFFGEPINALAVIAKIKEIECQVLVMKEDILAAGEMASEAA